VSLLYPFKPEARDFSISGNFDCVGRDTVEPCISDLLGNDRQLVAMLIYRFRDFAEVGRRNGRTRKLLPQVDIDLLDFVSE
jgi:hypothetical protein